ncbi:DUF2007 domain-containing protein [Alteromonas sp. KUL49]|uniref:putative signal transducing protein n=1 Tax=Alteromonas sp. KUL49 TaxID=2480798 RepID=UPI00102F1CD5|nr:DUF2007 domain-containing protein [Alteromonas sp. KUL49]TAP41610.1 DUF2007 domain-containing protein [Alteromonas sp. KUL49]GEA10710.1 hypothetical protein KUL49_10850 [Alteromonas sp. KUL49]
MIKLLSTDDALLMQSAKSEFDALGIPYLVKNEFAGGAVGEIPWIEACPELWLVDVSWLSRATMVISSLNDTLSDNDFAEWHCTVCEEKNGAAFDFCWQCETAKPN